MEYKDIFASRIKALRKELDFTQQQIADETGISRTSINRYENGTREPDLKSIGTLAEFYNVSIDYLFGLGKRESEEKKTKISH